MSLCAPPVVVSYSPPPMPRRATGFGPPATSGASLRCQCQLRHATNAAFGSVAWCIRRCCAKRRDSGRNGG